MTTFTKKLSALLLGATALGSAAAMPATAEQVKLTLLGGGDLYEFAGDGQRGGQVFQQTRMDRKAEDAVVPTQATPENTL